MRVPVPEPLGRGDGSGGDDGLAELNLHRLELVKCAVVRVLKARREAPHREVVVEVAGQLASRFVPSREMIKTAIEVLIAKEYIERVPGAEVTLYRYLA